MEIHDCTILNCPSTSHHAFGCIDVMGSWHLLARRRKDKAKNHGVPILEPDTAQHGKITEATPVAVQKSPNILSFPDEILVLIMHQLPYGTLFILRQTCRTFHNLASDFVFTPVLCEPMNFMRTRQKSHLLSSEAHNHLAAIRREFTRQSLCRNCLPLFNDYERFIKKFNKLWKPRWCYRCSKLHPTFFFAGHWPHSCMGQKGYFAMCEHVRLEADYGKHHFDPFNTMGLRTVDVSNGRSGDLYWILNCPKGCHVSLVGSGSSWSQWPHFHGIKTVPMLEIELPQYMDKVKLRVAL